MKTLGITFSNLQKAVAQNTAKQGQTFLNTKTQDAITFYNCLQKYDVAVANPPYTDSGDFGAELKDLLTRIIKGLLSLILIYMPHLLSVVVN